MQMVWREGACAAEVVGHRQAHRVDPKPTGQRAAAAGAGVIASGRAQHNASINPPKRLVGLRVSKRCSERELTAQREKGRRSDRRRQRIVGSRRIGEKRVREQGLGLKRLQAQQP